MKANSAGLSAFSVFASNLLGKLTCCVDRIYNDAEQSDPASSRHDSNDQTASPTHLSCPNEMGGPVAWTTAADP